MSHFMRAFFSAFALLPTLSLCQAEPKCGDAAVLESYAEAIKCGEIANCAGDEIGGTSRDLAKMSDTKLQQKVLRITASKELPHSDEMVAFVAGIASSSLIGWRDAFSTMKAG
ncbi:MAG: hypothetical protein Q8Q73_18740, partial [Stagnimonas sp.]|nr:hypothetical protein [Stagnimonas sp.]